MADLPRALEAVAEMGYEGVEFAGYYGCEIGTLRQLLDDAGLKSVGTHTWWQHVPLVGRGSEDHLAQAIADSHTLGTELWLGIGDVPFPEPGRERRAGWVAQCEQYNQLAARVAADGLRVGYHNHAFEFEKVVEGERLWDILLAHLSEDIVIELDTGSAFRGGGDVLAILAQCAGRVKAIHLKSHSKTRGTRALIGEDDLPWQAILDLCQSVAGTEWFIIEYESDGYPRMEAVRRCLDTVKAMAE
jgi:sugar phosphate isomerase/epimerase